MLFEFENLKQYVKVRDNFTCQHCKGKSGDNRLEVHHLIPKSEGGKNKSDNLITLCSKCHHDTHTSSTILADLKTKFYKKQRSFKDAAVVSSMKTKLINDLKLEFRNAETSFGYITKSNRILHNIEKTHHLDAFCIARNFNAARLSYFYKFRQCRRHNRFLHEMKPRKGGLRRSKIAKRFLGKSNFERYDLVKYKNIVGFISGSTNGNAVLKDINYNLVINKAINPKYLMLIRKKQGGSICQQIWLNN